jgi:hypothetical protein
MQFRLIALATAAALTVPMSAQAGAQSGTVNGLSYTAVSNVIGQTSTATVAGGGNPIYLGQGAQYRGVVGLLMDYGPDVGQFVCSGSLNAARTAIISAAHCVSDHVDASGARTKVKSVTAYFYNGDPTDVPVYSEGAPGVTTVKIDAVHINPLYTGEVIDQNDISILKLASAAPSYAQGYDLYTGPLTGTGYNIAGYGTRSNTGGNDGIANGQNLGTGRLRQGDNRYDFAFGDPDFEGFWDGFFGNADVTNVYIADFDNGLAANDGSCQLVTLGLGLPASGKYCDLGRGATEVSTAGGDSGGPQFVDGKLASVTSFGLSFGTDFGDILPGLNDTFGEFNGFVPTAIHADFLAAIPEPATWALMITGFGLVGTSLRRQRKAEAAA